MILKILAVLVVLFFVYLIFFKKGREKDIVQTKKDESISDEMVECPTCKTYVSQKEAILSNGKFYCSKECLNNK
ncbi:PP0621 family protein [Arcobacter sp. YIC-80]|uniref:PP0621 family protein n=1 Tax=unclassified Arcobacter TaxID=2593671 RepID=UPI00384BB861